VAGVASASPDVVTNPTAIPRAFARSKRVTGSLSGDWREMVPVWVLSPVAMAEPAAAESVTRLFDADVRTRPVIGADSTARPPRGPKIRAEPVARWPRPMPSPSNRITLWGAWSVAGGTGSAACSVRPTAWLPGIGNA
jgi:hypothetical protein